MPLYFFSTAVLGGLYVGIIRNILMIEDIEIVGVKEGGEGGGEVETEGGE